MDRADKIGEKAASVFFGKYTIDRETGCWNWSLRSKSHGYGLIRYKGKNYRSHRLMWEIENGEIIDGLCVLHRCDNRACINPDHLFLGTPADNTADMKMKGREAKGEMVGNHKLTASDVVEIRKEWDAGRITQFEIAAKYGIDHSAVSLIVLRKRWAHVVEAAAARVREAMGGGA